MEPLEDGVNTCPNCGYNNTSVTLANYLKPGTVLHERYLIGLMQSANGEGVTYIAFDQHVRCKVLVREYFPEQLCSRVPGSTEINVDSNHLAQYKALMAEYTELNKALARLRHLSHLNPALDLFAENNTTYAVYEYFEGGTLLSYLKENAGELSWNTVKRIFPPLFTSLSMLHNAGVLHRGLSPETIFVTDRGELKLRGFCISAVRTQDTELDAELFDGYAAPEQYFADRSQGTWTDVYGICAVLYRILTGARATNAISRGDYDNLIPPADVNPQVPDTVSQAIMRGLKLDASARVRTVTDLVTLLFEAPAEPEESKPRGTAAAGDEQRPGSTAVFPAQSGSRSAAGARAGQRPAGGARSAGARTGAGTRTAGGARPAGTRSAGGAGTRTRSAGGERAVGYAGSRGRAVADEPSLFERIRVPMFIAVLFLTIVALVILIFVQIWENSGTSPGGKNSITWNSSAGNTLNVPSETTEKPKYNATMPSLVGMDFKLKREEMAKDGMLSLEPVYEFSEEYKKDVIMWQEIEPNEPIVMGSTVKVRVSRGSCNVAIPDFSGMKLDQYLAKLEECGFAKAIEYKEPAVPAAVTTAKNSSKKTTTTTTTTTLPANVQTGESGAPQIVYYKEKVDYRYTNGYVCAVEPEVGSVLNVKDGYTITVYYASSLAQQTKVSTLTTKKGQTTTTTTKTTAKNGAVTTSSNPQGGVTSTLPTTSVTLPPTTSVTTPTTTTPPVTTTTPAPTTKMTTTTPKPVEKPADDPPAAGD